MSSPNLVTDLRWLIDIPSETGHERALRDAIADRLSAVTDVEIVGESLVAGRVTNRPRIDLYGHLDTVPENGNLPSRVEGGRVHGLGSSDMKAGLAVMLAALESEAVADGPYDVLAVFYDREEGPAHENGLEDALDAAPRLAEAELAVVMEPTNNELQLGCQGAMNASVVFRGVAAHSARPWLGDNAISKAGDWLAVMHARAVVDVVIDGLTFKETFVVTTASGGRARNVIPDEFVVNVNHRFPPDRTVDDAEAMVRELCAAADEVEIVDVAPPAPLVRDHPLVRRLEECGVADVAAKTAWTDVARLAGRGVAAVNFGPGDPALAHRADESVSVDALERNWAILERFLTDE